MGFNITYWRLLTHSSDVSESGKFKNLIRIVAAIDACGCVIVPMAITLMALHTAWASYCSDYWVGLTGALKRGTSNIEVCVFLCLN